MALAVLSAITASAVPHGHNHFHLHPARSPKNLIPNVGEIITPIAGRSDSDLPLDLSDGKCGGDTGFGCGAGFCCSKWGYCGVSEDYCGAGCQFGSCNGTATGPTPAPANNATVSIAPVEYSTAPAPSSSEAAAPVVTVQMTVTATGPFPVVTPSETSSFEAESISAAGIASKNHGGPAPYSQSWEPVSAGWGQPEWTSSSVVPTTFATQTSAPVVEPTPAPYSSVSVPAWTPSSSSVAAPETTSAAAPAYSAASSASAPSYSSPPSSGTGNGNVYKMYSGDGTSSAGWPTEEQWLSFDDMWSANLALIAINCDNSDDENNNLKSAISSISSQSGVPANYILAIIMQESKGCVRVIGTESSGGIGNPGLMQSHNGQGSCNTNGNTVTPCPMSEITKMVSDGTQGTWYLGSPLGGDGLQQTLTNPACSSDSAKYFQAARLYNSGSMLYKSNLATDTAGTPCYASDIANRLMGWTTASTACNIPVGAYSG